MLERLENYAQVREGDFVGTREGGGDGHNQGPRLAKVCETTERDCFYYIWANSDGKEYTRGIQGNELENVVLLRRTKEGFMILAGKKAYKELSQPSDQKTPSEDNPKQVRRNTLKPKFPFD